MRELEKLNLFSLSDAASVTLALFVRAVTVLGFFVFTVLNLLLLLAIIIRWGRRWILLRVVSR